METPELKNRIVISKKNWNTSKKLLDTLNSINKAGKVIYSLLKERLNPDSIKLVQNNGNLQEVKHYHLHFIPFFEEEKDGKDNVEEVYNLLK